MLFIIVLKEKMPQFQKCYDLLINQDLSPIIAKDMAHALTLLEQEPYGFHGIIFSYSLFNENPSFLEQLNHNRIYRFLPKIIYNAEQQNISDCISLNESTNWEDLTNKLNHYRLHTERSSHDIGQIKKAEFHLKTVEQAHLLAKTLATQFPQSEQMLVGIIELLINAIEHGNLGITFDEKTQLLANGQWIEEVERRLRDPLHANKKVTVSFERTHLSIKLSVADEGEGFNWHEFEQIDPRRLMATHGRGIMMARSLSFNTISYNETGNCVTAEFFLN